MGPLAVKAAGLMGFDILLGWVIRLLITVLVVALIVALIAVVLLRTQTAVVPGPKSDSAKLAIVETLDYEVIADLEDLVASDDSNSWEDGVLL